MRLLSSTGWRYFLLVTGLFLFVFLLFYFSRDNRLHNPQAIEVTAEITLFLETRSDLDELITYLEELDVSYNEQELRWASRLLGWRNFSAGRYELSDGYSYQELLSKLALGLQDHAAVSVPSGSSKERIAAALGRQLRAETSEFISVFYDEGGLAADHGLTTEQLFARMLPDTYNIFWTSDPERVVRRIYQEFERRVAVQYSEDIENHELDMDQLIVLASIVEWEAANHNEKPVISGLYQNRLDRNMRLQADPTVIYALGEHRRLLYEDYQLDHPYNTYLIQGLPPGPITNPDIHSLRAAIHPDEHDYLYMVASPQGGHVFSRTFEEHRTASAEWRRWIQEQYRIRELREQQESDGSASSDVE